MGKKARLVYQTLKAEIIRGDFRQNPRLPAERELCTRFSCSHDTVRRALAHLARKEMIESRRGSGTFVHSAYYQRKSRVVSVMYLGELADLTVIQDVILSHNCMLTLYSQHRTFWNHEQEKKFLIQVLEQRHRGLLAFCSPNPPYNEDLLQKIEESGCRVIHYEYYRSELPAESFVLPDYHAAGVMAAMELLLAGCHKLWLVGMDSQVPFEHLQMKGFLHAMAASGVGSEQLQDFDQYGRAGNFFRIPRHHLDADEEQRFSAFINQLPPGTGLFCDTDDRAGVMLHELQRRKIQVPEHVKILGTNLLGTPINKMTDFITFNRAAIFNRAISAVFSEEGRGIRELVPPHINRVGTIRSV